MAMDTSPNEETISPDWPKIVLRMVLFSAIFPIVLFAAAGRLDWWMGWVYVIIAVGVAAVGRYLMIRKNPGLLAERSQAGSREDTKGWDKILVPLVMLGPLVQIIVAGLDMRYDWSAPFPLWLEVTGIVVMLIGYLFTSWAMLTNAYFSSMVRIQSDRGQQVVTDGPYRIVRHPSYTGAIIGNIGTSLVLSSWWSLVVVAVVIVLLFIRTGLEDATLHKELPGYADYAQQTRFRLIPGVW